MEEDIKILEDMRDNINGAMQFEDDYQVAELEEKQFDALNLAIKKLKNLKKENEKAYLDGFKDSEEKYNTVIAENMKLKEEIAKKGKRIMKLKNLNKRLMKGRDNRK